MSAEDRTSELDAVIESNALADVIQTAAGKWIPFDVLYAVADAIKAKGWSRTPAPVERAVLIERIARRLAIEDGNDPDELMTWQHGEEHMPAWSDYTGRAHIALEEVDDVTPVVGGGVDLAAVLAAHRYVDVTGDYEIKPYTKQFGCTCGWEQNIAGMSGWRSWLAAHEAHVAAALRAVLGGGDL